MRSIYERLDRYSDYPLSRAVVDECILWRGCTDRKGRPVIWYEGRTHRARRLAYTLYFGDPGADSEARPRCDEPLCVNPCHIWLDYQPRRLRAIMAACRDRAKM